MGNLSGEGDSIHTYVSNASRLYSVHYLRPIRTRLSVYIILWLSSFEHAFERWIETKMLL